MKGLAWLGFVAVGLAFQEQPRQEHFDSQDGDWEAFGMPNYSKLTGQDRKLKLTRQVFRHQLRES